MTVKKINILSGNALKIIAAVTMFIDHFGMIFFPQIKILRIIGRSSFPIFAFFIAEGCRHTKSKLRYFLTVFTAGAVIQLAYYIYNGDTYMSIFITFSLSILMIYALMNLKRVIFSNEKSVGHAVLAAIVVIAVIGAVYKINQVFTVSYGFAGCLVPVFASLFMMPSEHGDNLSLTRNGTVLPVITMGLSLLYLSYDLGGVQIYSLAAIPLLLLYSGKRGKRKMKYFFYIFYPLHLAILQGLKTLLNQL